MEVPGVRTIRTPNGGQVPDVAVDAQGTLHLTYGSGQPGNAFYVQTKDAGKSFSKPVQLNQRGGTGSVLTAAARNQ